MPDESGFESVGGTPSAVAKHRLLQYTCVI